jgi:hypothetical protein
MDNNMDLVYICRNGDNEELRYSIRSAVKNLPHDKIWVVGGKPDWYTGDYIEVNQGKSKYRNARNNLKAICNAKEISESFILMNDDFYIVNKIDSIPYMYAGTLSDKIKQRDDIFNGNTYTALLRQTLGSLSRKNINTALDYELHVPMIMEKKKLSKVLGFSGLWRSVYGNMFEVGGIKIKTMRLLKPLSIVLVMLFTTSVLIFIIKQELKETYSVTLENGTTFEANRVTYYNSGIVDIRKTNDERIQIPTRSIKQVKIIESK